MADGKIKISELSEALQINNDAVFPYAQDNGGTDATFKGTVVQIARKVNEGVDFTNLETSNKKIVGAINQTLNNFAEEYDPNETYNTGDPSLYNGTLYKCKADNTTGAWDSSKWEEAKAVDFGSGGGSGGHTILDDSGTALTQRTNLQFKGAYSEDNATDNATEVNVVREMTKAEFDELTEEEKTGFINITDVTGGEEDKFQPVIYSETEREIGVWVNGKPIYQMSWVFSTPIDIQNNSWVLTSIDCSTIDDIVKVESVTGSGSNISIFASKNTTSNVIELQTPRNQYTTNCGKLTLWYTKTTDTAGSGQWTPQGVPAHHYSEDEQIVGTWIDGSTIYERVFDLGSDITISYNSWSLTTISLSSINRLVNIRGINGDGTAFYGDLLGGNNNGYLQLQTSRNGQDVYVRYVVFEYTKSST